MPARASNRLVQHATVCCIAIVLVTAFSGVGQRASANKPPQSKRTSTSRAAARQVFESTCSACHGLDGRGGERGPDISSRPQIVQMPDLELMEVLRNGRPSGGMPAFAALGDTQLRSVMSYLRFLQGERADAAIPGDAAKGKTIFFGKGRCADCHMTQGQGGFLGSDLSAFAAALSAEEIRKKILTPREDANHLTTLTLGNGAKIAGIVRNEDNFSIQLQSLDGTFHFIARPDIFATEASTGPIMPNNYATLLTSGEFDDLVKYLATVAKPAVRKAKPERLDEEN
jgi:putative heme-binding domain-containing protein